MITTKEEKIGPDKAKQMLNRHYLRIDKGEFIQRHVAARMVAKYAADMAAGNWLLSPNPITLDEAENIVDGQHRLEAVCRSGCDVQFMVSRGWPVTEQINGATHLGTIDVIDRGRPRTIGQQLSLHQTKNALMVAASVSAIVATALGHRNMSLSYPMVRYILDSLDLMKHVEAIEVETTNSRYRSGRVVGPIAYYHTAQPKIAKDFAYRLFTMDFEKHTGPWVFARYLQNNKKSRLDNFIEAFASCIRAFENGEKLSYIRGSPENAKWLSNTNPKLKEAILKLVGKNGV